MIIGDYANNGSTVANVEIDGPGSSVTINENLQMIDGGTVTVSGGAQLHTFAASAHAANPNRGIIAADWIGQGDSRSTMTVTGTDSRWQSDNEIRIHTVGTLNVENGATVSSKDGILVGSGRQTQLNSPSALLIVDDATLVTSGYLDIANGGAWAQVEFAKGATIETKQVRIATGGTRSGGIDYAARADMLVSGTGTTWTDSAVAGGSFIVGYDGGATLDIVNGAVVETGNRAVFGRASIYGTHADVTVGGGARFSTLSSLTLGETASGNGTLTVAGSNSRVEVGGALIVGRHGKGALSVTDSADVQVSGDMAVGGDAGSEGRVEIDDATLRVGQSLAVRESGTLSMENGARLDVGDRFVGLFGGTIEVEGSSTFDLGWIHVEDGGTLRVSGLNTKVTVSNTAGATAPNAIGRSSDGTLELNDHAELKTANIDIGRGSVGTEIGQSARAIVTNNAHWESGELSVGVEGGHGELHITGAGTVASTAGYIADGAGGNPARSSTGLVAVSGIGSAWMIVDELTIGTASAQGQLLIVDGATVTAGGLAGNGNVSINTGAALTVGSNNTNTTFAGVIDGDSDFTKTGSGHLTLTGENTFAGITTIDQGSLVLGNGGTSGSVAGNIVNNNAFLAFNRSDNVTYAGVLSGSGATSFIGSGMTTLTGNSGGLSGQVFITDGNLRLASGASLGATALTAGTGGALSGLGTVVGNVNVEGRLAPGGEDLGTLTVTGNVAFQAGSTYAVRIRGTDPMPSGQTVDSLAVAGTADLAGGTVEIAAIDPRISYVDGHRYATPIVSAGDLGGTEFDGAGMASGSAFITPTLSYEGNDVFLTIAVTQDFTTAAGTFNQVQAAGALNGIEQSGDALLVFNTIANMNEDDARRAFDLTSGEVHAAGQHVIDQTFALFNRTLRYQGVAGIGAGNVGAQTFTAPLGYGPAVAASSAGVVAIDDATASAYADTRVRGAWAAPLGGFGHVDADGNAGKLDYWNAGLAGGYEGALDVASGNAVAGFGFGYIHSRGTVDARLSSFDADGFYLGAYGAWTDGPWNVAGSLSYGANRVSTERNVAFMGTTAEASYWTHTIGLSGEASYAFDLADTTKLAPLFTLDAGWSGHGGFTETGAGALNLTSGSQSWSRLDTGLGLALTHTILTDSGKVTLEGRAVWEHAFSDVVPSQNLALAGSPTSFTVLGPDAGRDRLRIGAGLSWDVSDDMTIRARYDGLFSGNQANHAASLGLNVRF